MDDLQGIDFTKESVIKIAEARRDKNLRKRHLFVNSVPPKYVIYVRKSTKGVDKQERSIQDQLSECRELAEKEELPYKESEILIEEESAKKAGKRNKFEEMLENIRNGRYNSIISWHPDRLSRNMKDAGIIIDMVDNHTIIDLKFPSFTFINTASGKMALGIQFVLAKQYSDSLSDTTKRGTNRSVEEGNYMGKVKFGYTSVKGEPFRENPNIYPKLRLAWELALKGYSLNVIVAELTKLGMKINSKKLGRIFNDTFYAGIYLFGEKVVILSEADPIFAPMVSYAEYLKVASLLGERKFQKSKVKQTLFVHFVKCGFCGRYMTAGASASRSKQKYYYLNCMNPKCITHASRAGTKHFRSIRASILVDSMVRLLRENLNSKEEVYNHSIDDYKRHYTEDLKEVRSQCRILEAKLSNLNEQISGKEHSASSRVDSNVRELIQQDVNKLYNEKVAINKQLEKLDEDQRRILIDKSIPIMTYEEFLNQCQDLGNKMEKFPSFELLDEIARTVFLNLVVKDKKLRNFELQEPYKTYRFLGTIPQWVADGI